MPSLLIFLAACDQPLGTVIDISGRWTGTATNFIDYGDGTASLIIIIDQEDEFISGTLTASPGQQHQFTGSILRNEVFISWRSLEDGIDYRFTGLLTGRSISGTWRMGDTKTFETLKDGKWSVSR
ncbi:MAG: hypothetical protein ACNA8K_08945 [Cyclonatronaceae bacterium]